MEIKRSIFWTLYYLFARHLPGNYVPYSFYSKEIRAFFCKPMFRSFGKNVDIGPNVEFFNVRNSEIGDNSGIGAYSSLGTVRIGNYVMMGTHCLILSQNHRFDDLNIPMCKQGFQQDDPVIIEDDVWIGSKVIILPGVRVGHGSIIGAGTVVTGDVEPYTIVGGNPARVIGKRDGDTAKKN
jgi:maltose O-acetyltransferase